MSSMSVVLTLIFSSACVAQQWEVGALGGFGSYYNATVTNPTASVRAGYEPRLAIGAIFGQNMYKYVSGEIRYMYLASSPVLKSQGTEANTSGYTNVVHYDLIFHAAPNESRLRPYFAAGGGITIYSATGRRFLTQPLSNFAVLTPVDDAKPMVSVGAGLKYLLSRDVQLRMDFHTYITPAPNSLFRPTPPSTIHGWIYSFIPMVGISYVF